MDEKLRDFRRDAGTHPHTRPETFDNTHTRVGKWIEKSLALKNTQPFQCLEKYPELCSHAIATSFHLPTHTYCWQVAKEKYPHPLKLC